MIYLRGLPTSTKNTVSLVPNKPNREENWLPKVAAWSWQVGSAVKSPCGSQVSSHTACNSSSRGLNSLFCPLHTCETHTHTCLTHKQALADSVSSHVLLFSHSNYAEPFCMSDLKICACYKAMRSLASLPLYWCLPVNRFYELMDQLKARVLLFKEKGGWQTTLT